MERLIPLIPPRPIGHKYRIYFDRGFGSETFARACALQLDIERARSNCPSYIFRNWIAPRLRLGSTTVLSKRLDGKAEVAAIRMMYKSDGHIFNGYFFSNCYKGIPTGRAKMTTSLLVDYRAHVDNINLVMATRRYPHRHATHLSALHDWALLVAAYNAFRIYKLKHNVRENFTDFLNILVDEFRNRRSGREHRLEKSTHIDRCIQCFRDGKASNSWWYCPLCDWEPHLHKKCFEAFHANL